MAEELNMHLSLVSAREDTSSLTTTRICTTANLIFNIHKLFKSKILKVTDGTKLFF